jgi:hypothetical protein
VHGFADRFAYASSVSVAVVTGLLPNRHSILHADIRAAEQELPPGTTLVLLDVPRYVLTCTPIYDWA